MGGLVPRASMDRRGDQNPSEAAQAGSISLKIPQWSSQAMETKDLYEFGPFRADGRRKSLTRNGELVPLPVKAFDVLYALLQKPGQTVLKDQLMKEVWPDTFVEEGNLTQMVFLLRKALGETAGGQPVIVTVPRQGSRNSLGRQPARVGYYRRRRGMIRRCAAGDSLCDGGC